eukprot:4118202-Prymnesium_polylepis.1
MEVMGGDGTHVGGVSSFGYAGTIVHAALRRTAGGDATGPLPAVLQYRRSVFPWHGEPTRSLQRQRRQTSPRG